MAAAKYPSTLLVKTNAAGDILGIVKNEWTANGATTAGAAVPFSLVVNEAIDTGIAASGHVTTANGEVLHYSAVVTGTKTFTIDARAQQGTIAAAIDNGSTVGQYLTRDDWGQVVADLVAVEATLEKNFMKRQAVAVAANGTAVDFASGDYAVCTLTTNWGAPVFSNPVDGHVYVLRLVQDATGSRTWTPPAAWLFVGGTKTLSTAANKVDIVTAIYDSGSLKYYATLSKDYS